MTEEDDPAEMLRRMFAAKYLEWRNNRIAQAEIFEKDGRTHSAAYARRSIQRLDEKAALQGLYPPET